MPQPPVGFLLQRFPLARSAHPSRGHLLPGGYPPTLPHVAARSLSPPLSPTSTTEMAGAWIPRRLKTPFPRGSRRALQLGPKPSPSHALFPTAPGRPGSERPNRLVQPASPASKPCSSPESVHADTSCPGPTADPLVVLCPSRVFSTRTLDPQTRPSREDSNTPCLPKATGRDPRDLSAPRVRWTFFPAEAELPVRRQLPTRCGPACTASRRRSFSRDLDLTPPSRRNDLPELDPILGASKYADSSVSLKRRTRTRDRLPSWGFSPHHRPRRFEAPQNAGL